MNAERVAALWDELAAVQQDCREANWDGFGALPLSRGALDNTRRLIESLPLDCPAPSIGAEPDGAFTLEWYSSPRRILSVSVSDDRNLHFAALFGSDRASGSVAFIGEVPQRLLKLIARAYQDD